MLILEGLFFFFFGILTTKAEFKVPDVDIQVFHSSGIRISIPHVDGMKLFIFNGKIIDSKSNYEIGNITEEVKQPKNGKWIIENPRLRLKKKDKLQYWIFVQLDDFGYYKRDQTFTTEELLAKNFNSLPPERRGKNCIISPTTVNNEKGICNKTLIFEDDFTNGIDPSRWVIEHKFVKNQREFASFKKSRVKVIDEKLEITPVLRTYEHEWNVIDEIDLGDECTGFLNECKELTDMILPIISGKITTKNKFHFRYGEVEIKAKLPIGHWIYPEIHLKPVNSMRNTNYLEAGSIRIAFSIGNPNITANGIYLGNNLLTGGVILSDKLSYKNPLCRYRIVNQKVNDEPWGKDFHTFGLIWTESNMIFKVDGTEYGAIEYPNGFFTIFQSCGSNEREVMEMSNQEYYLSVGVKVGGIVEFPDSKTKSWKNANSKAIDIFWNNKEIWRKYWQNETSLIIDHVKIWSL